VGRPAPLDWLDRAGIEESHPLRVSDNIESSIQFPTVIRNKQKFPLFSTLQVRIEKIQRPSILKRVRKLPYRSPKI
jgi:hypothetical protein